MRVRNILTVALLAAVALAFTPAAPAAEPAISSKPVTKDGLQVTVTLPKATFAASEPLKFAVRFKNVSDKPFTLSNPDWYWRWKIRFEDLRTKGTWQLHVTSAEGPPLPTQQVLKPGEVFELPVIDPGTKHHGRRRAKLPTGVEVPVIDPGTKLFEYLFVGPQPMGHGLRIGRVGSREKLPPGKYRLTITITANAPKGGTLPEQTVAPSWHGAITTAPMELEISGKPAAEAKTSAAEPAQAVPLGSVYSTSRQPGLHRVKPDEEPKSLPRIPDNAPPTILGFAWAKDFPQLNQAPLVAPDAEDHKPLALVRPAEADAQLWVVVFVERTGSQPPQWLLDSVALSHDNVWDVVYRHAPPGGTMTFDLFPYVAWIPLGRPAAGPYSLRLSVAGKVVAEQAWKVEGPCAPATPAGPQAKVRPGSGSVSGKCVDASGKPLSEAIVAVQQGVEAPETLGATSGKDGSFKIGNLPAGEFKLIAVKAQNPGPLFYSHKLTVEAGKNTDMGNMMLRMLGQTQHQQPRTGWVSGKLVDQAGTPLAGALAHLQEDAHYQATSESDGSFTIGKLPPGRYMLFAQKMQDGVMLITTFRFTIHEGKHVDLGTVTVPPSKEPKERWEPKLLTGVPDVKTIQRLWDRADTVFLGKVTGMVEVPKLSVGVTGLVTITVERVLKGTPPKEYRVRVHVAGQEQWDRMVKSNDGREGIWFLGAGETPTLASTKPKAWLEAAAAQQARTGSVSGKTVDKQGKPLSGVNVSVQYEPAYAELLGQTSSDKDGNFKIDKLRPGEFSLLAGTEQTGQLLVSAQKVVIEAGKNAAVGAVVLLPPKPKDPDDTLIQSPAETQPAATQPTAAPAQSAPDEQRAAQAAAVIVGKVLAVRDAEAARPLPISEHSPNFREAVVEVLRGLKELKAGEKVVVRFSGSTDVRWFRAPKLSKNQQAMMYLRSDEIAARMLKPPKIDGKPAKSYLVLEPGDVQAVAVKEGKPRALLAVVRPVKAEFLLTEEPYFNVRAM